ncbi:YHS domain-containing protein [Rhodocytophaga rosea]|uniref:YHS domain-containing protein n=1 Tax=Rhodocytophaga rosea TaxID=2704465 RepID=A0A6C0GQF4_9BACT|nr:YHS domain-containing (seleno)protein [Rhodocytophaga rosea]QHT69740.1 YHS domain-containing protein [Rhodocytophaga rosea]
MKSIIWIVSFIVSVSFQLFAQQPEVFTTFKGAINGYDAVAYFTEGKPVEGKKEYSHTWKGAEWYFSNQQNLKVFESNPEKFAPQYGGYCAYGMSRGYKATTEPDAWTIVDNKLYLNYNTEVRSMWKQKQEEYIKIANSYWPKVLKE